MSNASKAVFLSYASQDAEAAKKICEALRAAGIEVWFDQSELRGGDAWDQKIRKQIKECTLFVPIISANTQARAEGYFRLEWKLAVDRSHLMADDEPFILPAVIDDTRDAAARVPDKFRDVQWVRLSVKDTPERLAVRIGHLLRRSHESDRWAPEAGSQRLESRTRRKRIFHPAWLAVVIPVGVTLLALGGLTVKRYQDTSEAATKSLTETQRLVRQVRAMEEPWSLDTREDLGARELLLKRAVELDPTDGEAWAAYAQLSSKFIHYGFDRSGARRDILRRQAEMAGKLAPQSVEAMVALACWSYFNDRAEADRRFRAALERAPQHRWALRLMGCNLRAEQRWDEALTYFRRGAELPGRDPWPWWEQAVLFARQQTSEMENALEQTLVRAPVGRAYVMKAMAQLHRRGDVAGARKTLDAAPAGILDEDRGAFISAKVAFWERRPDRAFVALGRLSSDWMEDNTFVGPRRFLTGWAHHLAGRTEAAQAEWRAALQTVIARQANDAASPALRSWQARLLALLGQRQEAEAAFRVYEQYLAAPTEPETWGPATRYFDRIHINLLLGRKREALELARRQHGQWQGAATMADSYATFQWDPLFDSLRGDQEFVAFLAEAEAQDRRTWRDEKGNVDPAALNAKAPDATIADFKSVVVLPFANLSGDPEQEYFSDGLTEEILNALARERDLRVPGRASAFSFKGKGASAAEIAKALNVAQLVEGSVRKAGNRVRISVQLTRASDGFSEALPTVERELTDIFALQDEVARLVVEKLTRRTSTTAPVAVLTKVPAAYEAFLKGRALYAQTTPFWPQAASAFQQAVTLDPDFALAWTYLGRLSAELYQLGVDAAGASTSERAIAAARRLQPGLPELALAAAQHLWVTGATADAINRELTVAERLRPNDPDIPSFRAVLAVRNGDSASGVDFLRRAVALDPRNGGYINRLGNALTNLGRYEEAENVYRQAYEMLGSSVPITNLAWLYLFWKWDAALALRTLDEAPAAVRSDRYWGVGAAIRIEVGDFAGALAAVNRVTQRTDNSRIPLLNRAQIHEEMGDAAAARRDYLEALQIAEQQVGDFANSTRGRANLAVAYAGLGRKDEAIAMARTAARRSEVDDLSTPGSPWDPLAILPRILARFGQMDEAIELTERQVRLGRFRRNNLLYSTSWAELRKDPRFRAIAEKAQR